MRQWTGPPLVQTLSCGPIGAKALYKPKLGYYKLGPWEYNSGKFHSKFTLFNAENASHVVCKMAAILSGPQYVNIIVSMLPCTFPKGQIRVSRDYILQCCLSPKLYVVRDLFPAGPISVIFFSRRQCHAIVIFRLKSISDLDSGSLPRFFGEFIYMKFKIVVS